MYKDFLKFQGGIIMSKIGRKIITLAVLSIFITVILTLIASVVSFSEYNNSVLIQHAKTGVSVLKNDMANETLRLENIYNIWEANGTLPAALENMDTAAISDAWNRYKGTDNDFCLVTNASGSEVWKSSNYALSSFDSSAARGGSMKSGLLTDKNVSLFLFCSAPIKNGNEIIGACIVGLDLSEDEWLDNVKSQTATEVTLFYGNTRYSTTVTNSDGSRAVGTTMSAAVEKEVIQNKQTYTGQAAILGQNHYVCYEPMYDLNGNLVGAYFAGSSSIESDREFATVIIVSCLIGVAAIAVSMAVFISMVRKFVIKPIKDVSELADNMSRGNLGVPDFKNKFGNDEIGNFAVQLQSTKHALNNYISDITSILNTMATGDFSRTPSVQYQGDFTAIEASFEQIKQVLGEMLGNMGTSSDEVLAGSRQMADSSQSLAEGTTKQAAAIQQLLATVSEISGHVSRNADNAAHAKELSGTVEEKIIYQNQEVTNMVNAMNEIEDKSKEIEKIIKTIDDIAFQTNILALNAAVEAARAGEAGKGFAVVADEVRNLASKSAEAANNTTALISASISAVDKGSKIAVSTANTMKEVMDISKQTTDLIMEIAAASAEQNTSIQQISSGIDQISTVVQQNSATAEETAASCEELNGQSTLLKEQVSRFRV